MPNHAILGRQFVDRKPQTTVKVSKKCRRLVVINPGPGEYVHVMEGQRHGYRNLTIGITYTAPGGAPPMHTHQGEESHVLTSGQKVMYALGNDAR